MSTASGDVIVNGSFGSSGPAYWNNPSTDGAGCYNVGCLVSGQYGTQQAPDLNSLSWATNSGSGLGDFYFLGQGTGYEMKVLSNATANIIAFGVYDVNTGVKTALFQGDGSGTAQLVGSPFFSHVGNYGFYIDVAYTCSNPQACPPNLNETYKSESSNNTHTFTLSSLATTQHFAVFQTSKGFIVGAEDGLFWNGVNPTEGIGDFQDFAVEFTTVVPEPGSIALFGLGAAGLLALRRRRKA